MRILIATPASGDSLKGNAVTARRWATHARALGHEVDIAGGYESQDVDVLVALHARRSADSIERFSSMHPARPVVLILTGTDLYGDLPGDPVARRSVELASALVVLNRMGGQRLTDEQRARTHVVIQSVDLAGLTLPTDAPSDRFTACVVGHLREVKDPMLAARAARGLNARSTIEVVHLGAALDEASRADAERETRENPRYRWVGEVSHARVLETLARSELHLLTSRMEGGANVLCEAIAVGTPTLSTRIEGTVGIVGASYPGLFPVGDAGALCALLGRCEQDGEFLESLRSLTRGLQDQVTVAAERRAIAGVLAALERS